MTGRSSAVSRIDCTTLDRPNAYVVDDGEVGGRLRPADRITSYDAARARASIRELVDETDFDVACPGHGPSLEDGHRRLDEIVD